MTINAPPRDDPPQAMSGAPNGEPSQPTKAFTPELPWEALGSIGQGFVSVLAETSVLPLQRMQVGLSANKPAANKSRGADSFGPDAGDGSASFGSTFEVLFVFIFGPTFKCNFGFCIFHLYFLGL